MKMAFVTPHRLPRAEHPAFATILANTLLSTVPGISGAGPSPEKTVLTPLLDAELIARGTITSMQCKSDTPTGCPTPAVITRAVLELLELKPLFINAGLTQPPVVPCLDLYGMPGLDPRDTDAVPGAEDLFIKGREIGKFLSQYSDLVVLGECVPGGTTTALCVLRALGYQAKVSSSFVNNPVDLKEEVWRKVSERAGGFHGKKPLDIIRITGDPMIPAAAGLADGFCGKVILAGGTQMLAVAAIARAMGQKPPDIATTCYVRDDRSADIDATARKIGAGMYFVDPGFENIGHPGLARYCAGEVKEGMGAGGAMFLAALQGFSPDEIRRQILATLTGYR
jgi:uncharacterized protein (TIGR00303 family)